MTIFEELGLHLARHEHVTSVKTGTVTIGRETYPAAHYFETLQHTPGTPAYARGEREYTREMIYCVGKLPAVKCRGNVAFTIANDSRDWYVACYFGNIVNRKQETVERGGKFDEFHPFGNASHYIGHTERNTKGTEPMKMPGKTRVNLWIYVQGETPDRELFHVVHLGFFPHRTAAIMGQHVDARSIAFNTSFRNQTGRVDVMLADMAAGAEAIDATERSYSYEPRRGYQASTLSLEV